MRITSNITFRDYYIPPRGRKVRERQSTKLCTANVPETSYDEAPIALRVQELNHGGGIPYEVDEDGCRFIWREYRLWNGNLYKRVKAADHSVGATGWWTTDDLLKHFQSFRSDTCSDELTAVQEKFHAAVLSYLVIVDGVWRMAAEPVYTIATFGLGHNHSTTSLMVDAYHPEYSPQYECFNALQRDEAIEACKRVALRRGDTNSIPRIGRFWKIEVFLPEAVKAPAHITAEKDGFDRLIDDLVESSQSPMEAGLLLMLATNKD